MRHDVVSALARPLLVSFLLSDKVTLSEKQRERFEKAQAAVAAPKVKAKKESRLESPGAEGLDLSSGLRRSGNSMEFRGQ